MAKYTMKILQNNPLFESTGIKQKQIEARRKVQVATNYIRE